jgi:Mg2+/Co2+ transporter CorC
MISALQLWLAPVGAAAFTLWAAFLSLAAEAHAPLPRMLAARLPAEGGGLSRARGLRVIHLGMLVAAGALAAAAVGWWARPPGEAGPRFLLAVLLVWLVGDLLPRVLGAIAPELVRATEGGAEVSLRLFRPLLRLVAWADRGGHPTGGQAPTAPADREMLHGVFGLAEMTVAEVMTPRIDILAVDVSDSGDQVQETLRASGHARLLVFEGHPDAVVGVIHAKDLLPGTVAPEQGTDWRSRIRPVGFVPEAKILAQQLRDFQRGPGHLAVVVDEFGGTAGLVTLEDVLEQIVGEIRDEYDVDEAAPIQPQAPGRWLVLGGTPLAELEAHLDHGFGREDVDTVGGLALAVIGHVPRVGEAVELGPWRLIVDQVAMRRVKRVVVERATSDGEGVGGATR